MTDETDKPRSGASVRTAREAPLARGGASESESAPRAQRGQYLPRDPAGELDPAGIELAVLRDPADADEAVTRDRRRSLLRGEAPEPRKPETTTPESPGTRAARGGAALRALPAEPAEPLGPEERTITGGTLLSMGSVDPRAKTERDLETPRMFMTQAQAEAHAYFKPSLLPAVTVRPRLEVETVKLSDSVDPRKAKTIPRLERAISKPEPALSSPSDGEPSGPNAAVAPLELPEPLAEGGVWRSPASLEAEAIHGYATFERAETSAPAVAMRGDGRIHASLSAFRDEPVSDYSLHGASTRQEPVFARQAERASAPPDAVLTARDLPALRRPPVPSPLLEPSAPPPESAEAETAPISKPPPAPYTPAEDAEAARSPGMGVGASSALAERRFPSVRAAAISTPRPRPAAPSAELSTFAEVGSSEAPSTMTASITADRGPPKRGLRGWWVLIAVALLVAVGLSYLALRSEKVEAPEGESAGADTPAPSHLAPAPALTLEPRLQSDSPEPTADPAKEAPADGAGRIKLEREQPSGRVEAPAAAPSGSLRKSTPSKIREPIF